MRRMSGRYREWVSPEGLLRLEGWAREGLDEAAIAERMGVELRTLEAWRRKYPAMAEALRRGGGPVDVEAENALLKAALGYTVTVRKPFKVKEVSQKNGEGRTECEHIEYAEEEVHVPARITALIYWLKNRRPDKWRDRPQVEADAGDELVEALIRGWDGE